MAENTGTAAVKEKTRLTKLEDMTPEQKEQFEKMTPLKQEEYKLKLQAQETADNLAKLREEQAKDREAKKASREKESAIKGIIKDVREGTLAATEEAVYPRFKAMTPPLPEDEYAATLERIKTDSASKSKSAALPAKPAYELTHELKLVKKADFGTPGISTAPDTTLGNSVRRYGMIAPILARKGDDGSLVIMDGKRRFALAGDEDVLPVVIVSGFPDEDTAERAEVTVNRVRSLNILSVANALNRMRTRGVDDSTIRRDMGFKTGEIDKITSVINNLIPELSAALNEGNITPSVALSIAKLNKGTQKGLAKTYADRVKATPGNARISESDVEAVRQAKAAEAAQKATPTLAGLAGSVNEADTKAAPLDKGKGGKVDSSKSAPKAGK